MILGWKDVISTIKHRGDIMSKLEEIRRKTDIWCDQNVPRDTFFDLRWEEKFYELIVKECLIKIENEAAQYSEPVWAFELVNDIKEHFGVE